MIKSSGGASKQENCSFDSKLNGRQENQETRDNRRGMNPRIGRPTISTLIYLYRHSVRIREEKEKGKTYNFLPDETTCISVETKTLDHIDESPVHDFDSNWIDFD